MLSRPWRGFAFFLFCSHATLFGFSLNRNASQIEWRTVETEHFRFHYPKELEEVAGYVAGIAERVYPEKIQRYHIQLPNKVDFTIRDDIFSNGWANSLENTMNIWVTDWDFPIRSTHNWLNDVVAHEFSHLVSIQSGSKFPSYIQGLVFGYQSFYNAPVQGNLATIIPFSEQPNWFAEGVAQYESEVAGGDAWDSHRDMILRIATLENKLLPIDRMGTFVGTSLEYEQGPYTQGYALTRFIAARYGDATIPKLWAENARIQRQTLSGSMQRVLGKSDREVYEEWKNDLTARYAEQIRALGKQVYGQKLTSKGFYNYFPHWDRKGEGLFYVSNAGREDFRAGLGYLKLADTVKKEDDRFTPIPGIRGEYDVGTDDSTFVYASAKETDRYGMHKLDLYQRNARRKAPFLERRDPTEKRFTHNLNASQASLRRDGKRIAFVRAEHGGFRLCVAPVPEGRDLPADSVKTLFPTDSMAQGHFGFNVYTPKFSPDGQRILFSYFDGDSRNIGLINADGSGFKPLLHHAYDERDPEWAPDGQSFFFSSDTNGIYNLYRYSFADASLQALTNVAGGAFSPAVDSSGQRLAYINYDKDGFSLYLLRDLKPAALPLGMTHPHRAPTPGVDPIEFSGHAERYSPIPDRGILTPIFFGEEMLADTRGARNSHPKWLAGASGYLNDPVLKNEVNADLLLEVGNGLDYFGAHDEILSPDKESQFYLGLSNHALPVSLGVGFSRGNLTSSDTVRNRSLNGLDQDTLVNQNFALTFRTLEGSATYDLFDAAAVGDAEKTSFVRVAAGYGWNDFNFYDLTPTQGFSFTYFKDLYLNTLINFYGADYTDKGLVAPVGLAGAVSYTVNQSDLMRNGTFEETFVFENGRLVPRYRTYVFHDVEAGVTYGLPMPWTKHSALVGSAFVGSLLNWKLTNKDTSPDTLDSFFEKGLYLRGYPYLRDIEHLAFSGENTATLSLDMNQPVWPDIYRRFWTVFVEDIYLDLFWETGRAWNGSLWNTKLFSPSAWDPERHPDGWYQTVGVSLKINATIYNNYPFLVYLELASGLSGIPDGKGGLEPLDNIKIGSFDTHATRISFGASFGLYNGLLGRRQARNPLNPSSPFAAR